MKDMEYSYEYKENGEYCYPNSLVLRNKLDIRDLDVLHEAERRISTTRYFELETLGVTGDFSIEHLKSIHKFLFGDIYEWAGEIRTVDIAKGTIFCLVQHIEAQFENTYKWLKANNFLEDVTDKDEMADKLAYLLGEINMIHPFREGNGRTQRMYVEQICRHNGHFDINFGKTSREEMMLASIDTSVCKYETMTNLFRKCLIIK